STTSSLSFLSVQIRPPPISTLFPYTTLFRSVEHLGQHALGRQYSLGRFRVCLWHHCNLGQQHCVGRQFLLGNQHRVGRQHGVGRSEEHTSELQSLRHLVCRLLLEKKKK